MTAQMNGGVPPAVTAIGVYGASARPVTPPPMIEVATVCSVSATLSVAVPKIAPDVALMVVEPPSTPVARPALFTVATAVALDDQVTLPRGLVEASVNVAVAPNC